MPLSEPSSLSPRAALIHRMVASLGFTMAGIAPAAPSDHAAALRAWLDAGKHGDMDYLARYAPAAADPENVLPGVKAIICVMDRYVDRHEGTDAQRHEGNSELFPPDTRHPTPDTRTRIARYAQGDDYHRIIKDRLHQLADGLRSLFPDHLFRSTVDTAPLMEREVAARAGLGWVGKNTLLIHPQLGSYFFLGEILTTLPLETSADAGYPPPAAVPADHCGSCTRCIDACPTQCITPYSVDASRCISYLTIEHKGAIDSALHPLMQDWLAGCDVCQEVCPFNEPRAAEGATALKSFTPPHPAYTPRLPSLPILQLLNWTEEDRRATLTRSALKRIRLEMFKRNALIAAGNHLAKQHDETLRRRIISIAEDSSEAELVRSTARQVLDRLS